MGKFEHHKNMPKVRAISGSSENEEQYALVSETVGRDVDNYISATNTPSFDIDHHLELLARMKAITNATGENISKLRIRNREEIHRLQKDINHESCLALLDFVGPDHDRAARREAFEALIEAARDSAIAKEYLFQAIDAVKEDEARMRILACGALIEHPSESSIRQIVDFLKYELSLPYEQRGERYNPRALFWREDAIVNICNSGMIRVGKPYVGTIKGLYEYSKNNSQEVVYSLAHVLHTFGEPVDSDVLIEGVEHSSSPAVKVKMICALRDKADPAAVPVLEQALESDFTVISERSGVLYPLRAAAKQALDAIEARSHSQ